MRRPVWIVDVGLVEVCQEGSGTEKYGWKAQKEDTNRWHVGSKTRDLR